MNQPEKKPECERQDPAEIAKRLKELESSNVGLGWGLALSFFGTIVILFSFFFWPHSEDETARLKAIENQIAQQKAAQKEQAAQDWQKKIDAINEKIASTQEKFEAFSKAGQEISENVIGENAGSIEQRLAALEAQVEAIGGSQSFVNLIEKVKSMQSTGIGSAQLDAIVAELTKATQSATSQGQEGIDAALSKTRDGSDVVENVFAGIPDTELKAGAMLVAMTQIRSSLGRDDKPFEDDLQLLRNLVGNDNPQLLKAIDELAPHAQSGVLTTQGLSKELRSLAGDAVFASLSGQEVDFKQKAANRFYEIVQVEKDGVLVNASPDQVKMQQAQTMVDEGNLEQAIELISSIDGNAAKVLAPWLNSASSTLQAHGATDTLGILLLDNVSQGKLIQDEDLGVNIYRKGSMPNIN